MFILLFFITQQAHAFVQTCPASISFRHQAVGAIWEISNEARNLGWGIAETPAAQNFNGNASQNNPLYVVLSRANDSGLFYMTCKYQLMSDTPGFTVDAVQSVPQLEPVNNANFQRVNETTYLCQTTINHPEVCASMNNPGLSQVKYDFTGGSIN
jgi:hypothetical protein